jgi:hypothetical protein
MAAKHFNLCTMSICLVSLMACSQIAETDLKKYSYPVKIEFGQAPALDSSADVSGSIVCFKRRFYFVTAGHCLFDPVNQQLRAFNVLNLYLTPDDVKARGFLLYKRDYDFKQVCSAVECLDIAVAKLDELPKGANYIDLDSSLIDTSVSAPIYILAWPKEFYKPTFTTLKRWEGENGTFRTVVSNEKGGSGSPAVQIVGSKIVLAGVYSGRDLRDNTGIVVKAGYLQRFLSAED